MEKLSRGSLGTEIMRTIAAGVIILGIGMQVNDCCNAYTTDMISAETASYILDVLEGNIIFNN